MMVPRLAKPTVAALMGVFIVILEFTIPIAQVVFPSVLEYPLASPMASAQSTVVVAGTPEGCPSDPADLRPWAPLASDPSVCVLELTACGPIPWDSSQYLTRSAQYPEFCETVVPSTDPNYLTCVNTTGAVAIDNSIDCTLVQVAACSSGVQVGPDLCRTVERRTWTCPSGYVPRNEFNTCSPGAAIAPAGAHPACGHGAPVLASTGCEDYVGGDFEAAPSVIPCSNYDPPAHPGTIQTHPPNHYWCTYDSSLLDVSCHATGVTCPVVNAACIKRASGTGGCNGVAETIRCRADQAAYFEGSIDLRAIRLANCDPCIILPFQTVPVECPDEIDAQPLQDRTSAQVNAALGAVLRERRDIRTGSTACFPVSGGTIWGVGTYPGGESLADHPNCESLSSYCADPSPGRLTWLSNHPSAVAVVNSPVTIEIDDIPSSYTHLPYLNSNLQTRYYDYVQYPDTVANDNDSIMRNWREVDSSTAYGSVEQLGRSVRQCTSLFLPFFGAVARRLWPDNPADYQEMIELFGADSVLWWDAIATTGERRQRTHAQGIGFWPDLTPIEQTERNDALVTHIECDSQNSQAVWCRWRPATSGYYRLNGAGAWLLRDSGRRLWSNSVATISNRITNLSASQRQNLLDRIASWGLVPADFGIDPAATALLPVGTNAELYEAPVAGYGRCPPLDLRVVCVNVRGTANYSETEPVGVQVFESRIVTGQ